MGLDMYLTGERYLWTFPEDGPDAKVAETIGAIFPELAAGLDAKDRMNIKSVRCELMYWRKANAIHQWFVDNCQEGVDECQETFVGREKLQELVDACEQVLGDHTKAPELLPTQSGFFFGDTSYDEWYFKDVQTTATRLKAIVDNKGLESWDIYYRASW